MVNKHFSERLNDELNEIGVPTDDHERSGIISKWLRVPRHKAQALLKGHARANDPAIESIAEELEVNAEWLLGISDKKQH